MKDVEILRINLQESILIIDRHVNRIDSIIAMYSEHTNTITVRDIFWNSNQDIESYFKKELGLKKAPVVTSCSGFGIEGIGMSALREDNKSRKKHPEFDVSQQIELLLAYDKFLLNEDFFETKSRKKRVDKFIANNLG